jgi:hypothetical protein
VRRTGTFVTFRVADRSWTGAMRTHTVVVDNIFYCNKQRYCLHVKLRFPGVLLRTIPNPKGSTAWVWVIHDLYCGAHISRANMGTNVYN